MWDLAEFSRPVSGRAAILRGLDLACAFTASSSSLICSHFAKSMNSVRQEGSVCLHTTDTVVHRKEPPLPLGSHYSPRTTHSYTHSPTSLPCLSVGAVHECQRRAGEESLKHTPHVSCPLLCSLLSQQEQCLAHSRHSIYICYNQQLLPVPLSAQKGSALSRREAP